MSILNKVKAAIAKTTGESAEKKKEPKVAKKAKEKILAKYKIKLNGTTAKGRQEILSELPPKETLVAGMTTTRGTIGLEIYYNKKIIGVVPTKIADEIFSKYYPNFIPKVNSYKVYKEKGIYQCEIELSLVSDKQKK